MKRFIRLCITLLYLGVVIISVLILIKPGAAIFFIKLNMDPQAMVKDAGLAYRYRLDVNPHLIRTAGIQVYENGQLTTLASSNIVADSGNGSYAISASSQGITYIYFSASDNSSPITNARVYSLYLPLTFISRTFGMLYLILLLPLFMRLGIFALAQTEQRKLIISSPSGVLNVLDSFFDHSLPSIPADIPKLWREKADWSFWKRLFTNLALAVYFYIFMEWLFFITMPSFMSLTSFSNKVEILLLSALAFLIFCLVVVVVFVLLDILAAIAYKHRIAHYLELAVPSILLSSLGLLLIDNFTYTVFKFGIVTSSGIVRGLYGLFFIIITGYFYSKIYKLFGLRSEAPRNKKTLNRVFFFSLSLVVISSGLAVAQLDFGNLIASKTSGELQETTNRPNIILLGSDGLSANHLSVYGYGRDTTPRLSELAQTSLVADNAFTNASKTTGAIVALMTSKLPTQTRVMFPPNILTGMNSFQHLPGILKNMGYETIEFGAPYFADAYNYNLQNGYDMVNHRSEDDNGLSALGRKLGYDNTVYFLNKLSERISDRILHIFFLRQMQNPYEIVTHPVESISDEQKVNETLELLDNTQKPLFVHIHLLGTHGPRYNPPSNVFSNGETQNGDYMADFYDDTILAFDKYVGKVTDHLKANGQLDNTILIIYTDHNYKYDVKERIPLIIHFPFDQYAGRFESNVENIDIAPTVVDYLGIQIPDWMSGESLLHGELDRHRLIFSAMLSGEAFEAFSENNRAQLDLNHLKPPFFQFSYVNIIDCQKWYELNLVDDIWSSGEVSSYTSPCNPNSLLGFEGIKQATINLLAKDGFDTSSIR